MTRYLTILACTATCLAGAAHAAGSEWRITEASGPIQVLHAGVARIAMKGGGLDSGDTLVTGKGARAVVVRGDDYLVVAPNSRFRIAPAAAPGGLVQILEDFGNVVFKIKKLAVPHFGVQTPYLAAVVKGTTFSVTVTPKGASVQVIEGAVQVATLDGGATEVVRPGMVAVVSGANRYRLDVQGDATKTLLSPAAPAASEGGTAPEATTTTAENEERVITAVVDDSSNLGPASHGLVSGSAAPALVLAANYSSENASLDRSYGGADGGKPAPAADLPSDSSAGTGTGSATGGSDSASGGSGAGTGSTTGGNGSDSSGSGNTDSGVTGSGNSGGNSGSGNAGSTGSGPGNSGAGSVGSSSGGTSGGGLGQVVDDLLGGLTGNGLGNGYNGNGHGHGHGKGKGHDKHGKDDTDD